MKFWVLSMISGILFIYYIKNWNFILRSIFTFLAFFLTTYGMRYFNLYNISCSYYSIPIFAVIFSWLIFKTKIKKYYVIEILILASFLAYNLNLNAFWIILGCACFGVCDVLMQNSKKNAKEEIFYLSIALSLYFSVFINNNIFYKIVNLHTSVLLNLSFVVIGGIALQYLIFYIFKRISFCRLLPFRFLNLLLSNIIDGKIFSFINVFIISIVFYELYNIRKK